MQAAIAVGFLVPQDSSQFFGEFASMETQLLTNRADVGNLVGKKFFQQWFNQRFVATNRRQTGVELFALFVDGFGFR